MSVRKAPSIATGKRKVRIDVPTETDLISELATCDMQTAVRTTFTTSRLLDFFSVKELTAQIGHARSAWPLVLLKEFIDNALDACEESNVAPEIAITVDDRGLTVQDNGPGIPPEVVTGILDFAVRVSSREAYVSPCRGAQGNALKTVVAMPFVLDGEQGKVTISAKGIRHEITVRVDRIRPVAYLRTGRGSVSDRAAEIIEAVTLLNSLGKSDQFIGHQMELTIPDVRAVLKTGRVPVRQKQLFAVEPIVKQNKPQSKWEPVIEACKIHPAGKPNNQKT